MGSFSRILAAVSLGALASCATPAPQTVYVHVCPVAPAYSRSFETQAANELQAMGNTYLAVQKLIRDYGTVRKEIRECQAK